MSGTDSFYEVLDNRSGFLYAEFDTFDEAMEYLGQDATGLDEVTLLRCKLGAQTCERVEVVTYG